MSNLAGMLIGWIRSARTLVLFQREEEHVAPSEWRSLFVLWERVRVRVAWLLTMLVVAPALLPLFQPGFLDSHDGTLHLYRIMGIDRAIQQGALFPRWLPEFSFGYGYPLLNYYPPLSYYVAELFHVFGFGYIAAVKLAIAAGFLLAAASMFLLAREFLGCWPALFAAAVYTYLPYHLADAYMRGAIAEFWAFVFFPLLFWASYRLVREHSPRYFVLSAGAFGGLMLSHNLTALVFAPFLITYVALEAAVRLDKRGALLSLGALLLGLGLSAFYWMPAILEIKAVHVGEEGLAGPDFYERLTSIGEWISTYWPYRYFPNQGVLSEHPVSIVQLALIGLALVALVRLRQRCRDDIFQQVGFFLFLAVGSCFMQVSYSRLIWETFTPLQYLQFPWRFLALTAIGTAFVAAAAVADLKTMRTKRGGSYLRPAEASSPRAEALADTSSCDGVWREDTAAQFGALRRFFVCRGRGWRAALAILSLVALVAIAWPNLPTKTLGTKESDVTVLAMSEHDVQNKQMGASWAGEYVPIDVVEDRGRIPHPPVEARPDPQTLPSSVVVDIGEQEPWKRHLHVRLTAQTRLLWHSFYFPGWRANIDGQPVRTFPQTQLGLVAVDVPAGEHELVLQFEDTMPRSMGNLLSGLSVIGLAGILLFAREKRTLLIALGISLLLIGSLVWYSTTGSRGQMPTVVNARVGDVAVLLGYTTDRSAYCPGDTATVTLYWLALQDPTKDYQVFVHLAQPDDEAVKAGQHDGPPVGGFTPTTRWFAGEILEDQHEVPIAPTAAPGTYKLVAGLYDLAEMKSLPVVDRQAEPQGDRVPLALIPIQNHR